MEDKFIMKEATKRSVFRWIHIVFSIPILGYIYSPFDQIHNYAFTTRFVFVPIIVLSGLWMWKGHVVRRLVSKLSPNKATGMKTGRELEA
jgi:hypothetical protein